MTGQQLLMGPQARSPNSLPAMRRLGGLSSTSRNSSSQKLSAMARLAALLRLLSPQLATAAVQ